MRGRVVEALVTVKGRERRERPKEGRLEPERRRMIEPLIPLEFLIKDSFFHNISLLLSN